jgi:maltose O-acetyltransferase
LPLDKVRRRLFARFVRLVQAPRILKYRILSDCRVAGKPLLLQPAQFAGRGEVIFAGKVTLGYFPSPFFFSGYSYLEARNRGATIRIGDGTHINNNFVAISEHRSITIGEKVLIGTFVEMYDSNFHGLEPERRNISSPEEASDVVVEDNVFIGSNVKILKGVTIGRGSVIAQGSIVTKSVPPGVVAGGNPARVLKQL